MKKSKADVIKDLKQILIGIRSYLIAKLHEDAIKEYKELYRQQHSQDPSEEELNNFFQILVAHQKCSKQADTIIDDIISKISTYVNSKRTKNIIANSVMNASILATCFSYIIIASNHFGFIGGNIDFLFSPVFYINAIIITLIIVFLTAINFFQG